MTKTGRNEPCPCGSGKKYKKCCLAGDQAVRRPVNAITDNVLPPHDDQSATGGEEDNSDPFMAEIYDRFEDADFDRRVALIEEVLSQGKGSTDDLLGLVELLRQAVVADSSRREFNLCLTELRGARPDCWEEDGVLYAQYFITNALALEETAEIGDIFLQASRRIGRHADVFSNMVDLLAYHGRHQLLTEGLRIALPLIHKDRNVLPWLPNDLALRLIDCEILAWVEKGAASTGMDFRALRQAVEDILPELDDETLREYADHLVVYRPFPTERLLKKNNRLDLEQLSLLTATFAGCLGRDRGVPGITGLLAVGEIYRYLSRREAGELKGSKAPSLSARLKKLKNRAVLPFHPLCPDPETLDRYFSYQMHLFCKAYHAAAALAQCLPAWCDFLEQQGLLEQGQAARRLRPLIPLIETLVEVLENSSDDPTLALTVRRVWEEIG
jgi:hypothetical protein